MTNATAFHTNGNTKRITVTKNNTAFAYICKNPTCTEVALDCGLGLMRCQIKEEFLKSA